MTAFAAFCELTAVLRTKESEAEGSITTRAQRSDAENAVTAARTLDECHSCCHARGCGIAGSSFARGRKTNQVVVHYWRRFEGRTRRRRGNLEDKMGNFFRASKGRFSP